jgi:rubrerythrin
MYDRFKWQEYTKEGALEQVMKRKRKEREEMEKKLQSLAKKMDHLERAKRQEEAPLIEEAFQKRLEEEKILHEQEQLVCVYCHFVAYKVQMLIVVKMLTFFINLNLVERD